MRTCVLAIVVAFAVPARADRGVKLADVIAALAHAPAAPIPQYEIAAADASVGVAGAWPAPTVRVETNRLTAQLVAGIAIPLPILGTVGAARHEAVAHATVVRREGATQTRELQKRAVLAWIALARADAEVLVRATAATQAAALEKLTRERLAAGAGAEVDVSAAVAARARFDVAYAAAKRAQEATAAALAGILGWDPLEPLHAAGDLPGTRAVALAALRGRLPEHPDHALEQARITEAEATTARARTAYRPTLAVEVQASFSDPTTPGTDVLAGLTVELPVFAHVGDQVRVAAATTLAARARATTVDAQLAGDLVAAYRKWQAVSETVTALDRDVLPAQTKATQLAEQAYREGARDLATVLSSERDLAGVRADLATARGELAVAWIDVQVAAGVSPGAPDAP